MGFDNVWMVSELGKSVWRVKECREMKREIEMKERRSGSKREERREEKKTEGEG